MRAIVATLLTAATLAMQGCATQRGFPAVEGLANYDIVDAKLVRCAQPNAQALRWLAEKYPDALVINLRDDPWDRESVECERVGLHYINIPWNGLLAPSAKSLEYALSVIDGQSKTVIIHCQYGCERTGVLVACYLIRHGLSNAQALNDADSHGMSKMAVPLRDLVMRFK